MSIATSLLTLRLALILFPVLRAETHFPENNASLRFATNSNAKIIVPVSIDHSGPCESLVGIGTYLRMVDSSLGEELHLKFHDKTNIVGIGFAANSSMANVESFDVRPWSVKNTIIESTRPSLHNNICT